ncbi:hypothetical protein [Streptomyces sp. NRRL F-5123]|uniref:hypothetical protein n=1 Tax=Streptomyces sp. NRRL F-5123 TaxID=1463856 RepID=UPI0004E22D53|nr:hypothetical protein [Streptomyces sp. NRRL F-5123]
MADELDDRLHDLAHDAEQLVVLAGPQAARARGEKRRARRRATAAGTAAALALGITGWQLLPRLEQADGTHTAPPAASGTATPPPTLSGQALTDLLTERLLPVSSLPFGPKWQWTIEATAVENKLPTACGIATPGNATAESGRSYLSEGTKATAYERLSAFADEPAATAAAEELRSRTGAKCGMDVIEVEGSVWGPPVAHRAMGSSKKFSGVTVWIQQEGQYVAVLVVDSPHSPLAWQPGDEPDGPRPSGCMADSLDDLAMSATPTAHATTGDRHYTVGGEPTGNTYASGKGGTGADKGAYSSTDDC